MGSFLPAIGVALAAGLPALIYAIWRGRKVGPKEEEELVSRASSQAVEMMSTVLNAAKGERKALLSKLAEYEQRDRVRAERISGLEVALREAHERIGHLEAEVAALRAA